jgi:hypothetical protein
VIWDKSSSEPIAGTIGARTFAIIAGIPIRLHRGIPSFSKIYQ